MTKIGGAIFDLGSTLIHFDGDWDAVLQESRAVFATYLIEEGFDIEYDLFVQRFKETIDSQFKQRQVDNIERPLSNIAQDVLAEFGYADISSVTLMTGLIQMYAISEVHWQLDPAAIEVLTNLTDAGLSLGLISNAADEANVQRLINKANIRAFFDPILISAGVGIRKPDRRVFDMVLEDWTMPAHEAVMIGDSLKADILGAQGAGMHQIWINHKGAPPPNPRNSEAITPEVETADLQNIPASIQRMNKEG
jgi:FMN phosphatase YigB (HAD superfamily)